MFLRTCIFFLLAEFVVSALKVKPEVAAVGGNCPGGTLEASNHNCFKLISDRKTFYDAENSCSSLGGHLAVIDSLFTNTFLAGKIRGKGYFLIILCFRKCRGFGFS